MEAGNTDVTVGPATVENIVVGAKVPQAWVTYLKVSKVAHNAFSSWLPKSLPSQRCQLVCLKVGGLSCNERRHGWNEVCTYSCFSSCNPIEVKCEYIPRIMIV